MAKRSEVSMTPNVDLSTLAGPELRRLLDAARRRGQADLSYQILQEMASRREDTSARGGLFKGRRSAAPHLVEMNLGADPLERSEEPRPLAAWSRPPDEPAFEPEPELVAEAELEAYAEAPLQMPPAQEAPPRRSNRAGALAGVALSLVAAAALGWSVKGYVDAQRPTSVAAVAPVAAAAPAPLAARPLETPVFPPAAAIAQEPAPAPDAQPAPAPPPEAAAPTPDAEVAAGSAPAPADETPAVAPASAKGCASKAIPAERTICETPGLQRLQRDLQQAYAEALQAHQDRALLREHQLAWRDARSEITDPQRLTRLYEQRIRTLNSATADALRQR